MIGLFPNEASAHRLLAGCLAKTIEGVCHRPTLPSKGQPLHLVGRATQAYNPGCDRLTRLSPTAGGRAYTIVLLDFRLLLIHNLTHGVQFFRPENRAD